MTARTHDIIAFAALLTIASLNPPQTLNIATASTAIVANIVGSLLPDMDQASNRLWDLLPAGDSIGKVFRKVFLGHRTLSHSILGAAIIYKALSAALPIILNPSYIDSNVILIAIMIGYISHLVADSLTKEGLPLLFPLQTNFGIPPLKTFRIKTDGAIEKLIILPAVGFYIFWFIGAHQDKLLKLIKTIN